MRHEIPTALPSGGGDPLSPPPRPGHFSHDRWDVLQLIKDTSRALGISEREIAVLGAHLSVLPKGPVRSDHLLMSFAEVGGILERANCMDERRFRRGEARLTDLGLITRKLSGNGRRYPVRDGRGQIVDAYGIDLRPLFLKVPELLKLREELAEQAARKRALKSRISARMSGLRRAITEGALPWTWTTTLDDIQRLCRRARVSVSDLVDADARLNDIQPDADAVEPSTLRETVPDKTAADAGQTVRSIESPKKEIHQPRDNQPHLQCLNSLWLECPKVAAYFPEAPKSETDLLRYIYDFLGFIGLTTTKRPEVAQKAPPGDMLRMLEYLMQRLSKIGNPAAYFQSMLRKYEAGEPVAGRRVMRGCQFYDRGHKTASQRSGGYDRGHNPRTTVFANA